MPPMIDSVISIDRQAFLFINHALAHPALGFLFECITRLGEGWYTGIAAGLFFALYDRKGLWRHLPLIVLSMTLGGALNGFLKNLADRPRPLKEFADLISTGGEWVNVVGYPLKNWSFPSGHTQTAFAAGAYIAFAYKSPAVKTAALATALLVGISRMAMGVHFPLDVLAGAAVGSCVSLAIWAAGRRVFDKRGET